MLHIIYYEGYTNLNKLDSTAHLLEWAQIHTNSTNSEVAEQQIYLINCWWGCKMAPPLWETGSFIEN